MALVCVLYGNRSCVGRLGWSVGKRVVGDNFVGVEDVKDPYAGQLFFKVRQRWDVGSKWGLHREVGPVSSRPKDRC
jgi:hypothetical protein